MRKLLAGMLLLVGFAAAAGAVEYRLQVANFYRDSFAHYFVALQGAALADGEPPALRFYIPYRVTASPTPQTALSYSLDFLRFYEAQGPALWDRYLSRSLGLAQGIAVVVRENPNPSFADWVYIVVQHPPRPTTFKAVVGWERRRGADRSNLEGASPRE